MEIIAEKIGIKFNKEWIFRNASFNFSSKDLVAIVGNNGSGKSTLLQTLTGNLQPNEGKVIFKSGNSIIAPEDFYKYFSFVAPYYEVIEEMTVVEFLNFHHQFKPFYQHLTPQDVLNKIQLEDSKNKKITQLSSGMRQRIKLGIALYCNTPILLLDEPTTNLDTQGIDWYRDEIMKLIGQKTIIISSNQRYEYDFCDKIIQMQNYKSSSILR